MDWWQSAACVDEDPELFFPVGVAGPAAQAQQALAKEVCHRCPVINQCLDYALESGVTHGVWGGTDEEERRMLRQRARRQARGASSPGGGQPRGAPARGGQPSHSGRRRDGRSAAHAPSRRSDQRTSR
ncbi:WhiB family transcriptional regulator [Streptomyces sp. RTd22]|uniref:WhiB family transcriptional regulator n=1 Tax=Streptomyces sp. RTd22 TaxID=1841249 RepID=UPI0007D9B73D|nr:WhiB family transcriptional regulator [Streptomyces sp. RTd22]